MLVARSLDIPYEDVMVGDEEIGIERLLYQPMHRVVVAALSLPCDLYSCFNISSTCRLY